jgi:Zn finger protein HypA/HybF involved in hydrogenase expression
MSKKITTEIFINRAKQIHGNKYDYSKVEYKDKNTKVCIICLEHGEFWQTPNNHYRHECPKCGVKTVSLSKQSNTKEFVKKIQTYI